MGEGRRAGGRLSGLFSRMCFVSALTLVSFKNTHPGSLESNLHTTSNTIALIITVSLTAALSPSQLALSIKTCTTGDMKS